MESNDPKDRYIECYDTGRIHPYDDVNASEWLNCLIVRVIFNCTNLQTYE